MRLTRFEMNLLRLIPDSNLSLPKRWFTGKEWEDGTAESVLAQDYRDSLVKNWIVDETGNPLRNDDSQLTLEGMFL